MSVLRPAMRTHPDVAVILLNHADYAQRYLVFQRNRLLTLLTLARAPTLLR